MNHSYKNPSLRTVSWSVATLFSAFLLASCADTDKEQECDSGETEQIACANEQEGIQERICIDGQWENQGDCEQPDACQEGDTQQIECGKDNAGLQDQECRHGAWVQIGDCVNADCVDGEELEPTACGLNGTGSQAQKCVDGHVQNDGVCEDDAVCVNDSKHIVPCGKNNVGQQRILCTDGQWTNEGACQDDPNEQCVNGTSWEQLCGYNNRGSQPLTCDEGAWKPTDTCNDPDECQDDVEETQSCEEPGQMGTAARTCIAGQWKQQSVCEVAGMRIQNVTITAGADNKFDGDGIWNVGLVNGSAANGAYPPGVLAIDLHNLHVTDEQGHPVQINVQSDDVQQRATLAGLSLDHGFTQPLVLGVYSWELQDDAGETIGHGHFEIRSDAETEKSLVLSGLSIKTKEASQISMQDELGTIITPASVTQEEDETRHDYITISNVIYSYEAIAAREDVVVQRGKKFSVAKQLVTFTFYAQVDIPVRVTKGADFAAYRKVADTVNAGEHYIAFLPIDAELDEDASDDDYDAYIVAAPSNGIIHVEASIPGQTVKTAYMLKTKEAPDAPLVLDLADIDDTMVGDNGYKEADILTNAPYSSVIQLSTQGKTVAKTDLDLFRVWQAMKGDASNYFVDPHYIINLQGEDAASAQLSHTPGREQVYLRALEPGVSILTIAYEPIHVFDAFSFGMFGNVEPAPPGQGTNEDFFNAIAPQKLGVIVVQVDEDNVDAIDMGIHASVFDTFYYDREVGHADFNFMPTANADLEVCVHTPLHQAQWDSDWHCFDKEADNSFTIALTEGRNIVRARTENSQQFYVLRAAPLDMTIENVDAPGEPIHVGDAVRVRLQGLFTPVPKLSGIYNPGVGSRNYVTYTLGGEEIEGEHTQYAIRNHGVIDLAAWDDAGTYTLENGQIYTYITGQKPGAHLGVSRGGSRVGYTPGDPDAGPWFSVLPKIEIHVQD